MIECPTSSICARVSEVNILCIYLVVSELFHMDYSAAFFYYFGGGDYTYERLL